ncbi:MAG: carboxypeptidase-like regulatory domain-containing protein, partial [Holophagales bacterium]|nr:carboxypeptidase-like regulatory domain-containing protein [Holophagales bacterium]
MPSGETKAEMTSTPAPESSASGTKATGTRAVEMSSRQQPFTAGVEGEVTDQQGESLPAVLVVLRHGEHRIEARTGEGGRFRFNGIRPGSWVLEVEGEGFEPVSHGSVQVRLGRVTTVRVRLAE